MSGEEPATQIAPVESPQMVSTVKLPILKKGEYTLWSMRMEQYLTNTDYSLWQVILNGDGPIQVTTDEIDMEYDFDVSTTKGFTTASVPVITASATPEVSTAAANLVYIRRSAEKRKDKGTGGYKQSHFKGMSYEDIRPIFKRVWDQNNAFVPKDSVRNFELLLPVLLYYCWFKIDTATED
ncbi:hypothetical protein Tco_1249849 [Tanacetum coccineum]